MEKKIIQIGELEGYNTVLNDIKSLLGKAKLQAYKAFDNIRVQTYWQIGERIAREEFKYKDRADYGKNLINKLSKDLGFYERLLYRMLQFYKAYPILSQVATELSWSHYIEPLSVKNKDERSIYEILSIKNSWGRNQLRVQIKNNTAKKFKKVKFEVKTNGYFISVFRLKERVGEKLGERLGEKLGESQLKIFELVNKNKFVTIPELSKELNISTTAVENNMAKLKEKGLLKRIGSAKGGHWEVRK